MLDARLLAGLLRRHAEIEEVHQHLHLTLRLKISPHDTERKDRTSISFDSAQGRFGHERRDDGMERPLVRLQLVEIGRIEREQLTAILQAESKSVRHKTRTPSIVNALNERDHIAFLVRGRQIYRIRGAFEPARLDVLSGPLGIDKFYTLGGVVFGDERFKRNLGKIHVGVVHRTVLER